MTRDVPVSPSHPREGRADRSDKVVGVPEGAPLDGVTADNPAHPRTREQTSPAGEGGPVPS